MNTPSASAPPKAPIHWPREIMASFVVFLVALPLCMGIALASGLPPALGLITGIVGGIVVGSIAGSPLQVSGPAAGLVVLVFDLHQRFGLEGLGLAVLVAGLIQVLAGGLKLGRWFRATSPAVIEGMLAGIGVLILGSQLHMMIDDKARASGLANLAALPEALGKVLTPEAGSIHPLAALVGVTTIVVMLAWNRFRPKALKSIPGALLGIIAGGAAAILGGLPVQFVQVPASLTQNITLPSLATLELLLKPEFVTATLALALIASAESLLSAAAVDKMHDGPRTDYNRELLAQGIGNTICGVLGALPMTGVIVRSAANVEAGAKTRASAILHATWLLGLVVALPWLLAMIPRAGLAAILVLTGYKLLNPKHIVSLYKKSRGEFVVFMTTLTMIVAVDLLTGVVLGLAAAAIRLLIMFSRVEVQATVVDEARVEVSVAGAATFLSLPKLVEELDKLPQGRQVHLHITELAFIDSACVHLLDEWQTNYERQGGQALVEWDRLEQKASTRLVLTKTRPRPSATLPALLPAPAE